MASPRLEIQENSDTRYPEFSEINPRSIGFYSIDDKVGYSPTANNLKYLRRDPDGWLKKNRNFNLGRGLDTYIRKSSNATGNDDKIDYLLRWIMENNFLRKIQEENARKESYFVCLRGLLKTIMKTPFLQDNWIIDAVKDTYCIIFLCVFRTEDDKQRNQIFRVTEYFGQKFEHIMLTDDPKQKPDFSAPVNANKDFCLIFRTKMNDHNLIYGGEIDALDSNVTYNSKDEIMNLDPSSFVELKTSHIDVRLKKKFKELNLLNCWTQTYLSGIEDILWGFQKNGKLRDFEWYKTSAIPHQVEGIWSPRVSQGFLNKFLNFVKNTMRSEDNMTYFRFKKDTTSGQDSNFVVAEKMMPCPKECKIIPERHEQEIKEFVETFE